MQEKNVCRDAMAEVRRENCDNKHIRKGWNGK